MALLPARNILDGSKAPATTTGEMKAALGTVRDYIFGLLGGDSTDKAGARAALGAAPLVPNIYSKSVAGGATVTLTAAEALNDVLIFTGVLTANIEVDVPAAGKAWIVKNATTGAYALTLKTAAGSGVPIVQGRSLPLYCDGTDVLLQMTDFSGNPSPVPSGHIYGLTLSTAGASTTMSIAVGQAADSTNSLLMNLATAFTKTTSAWVAGTATGGKLSAAAIANNATYHFFLIRRPDTGVVDVGFDVSPTAPTLPANYTQFRRIFSWRTNGSAQWIGGLQDGDFFQCTVPPTDISAIPSAATLRTISVPSGINVIARIAFIITNSGGTIGQTRHWDPALGATVPSSQIGQVRVFVNDPVSQALSCVVDVRTNTSSQIYNDGDPANLSSYSLQTLGWFDRRGRDA
jgi:hypothetical protein